MMHRLKCAPERRHGLDFKRASPIIHAVGDRSSNNNGEASCGLSRGKIASIGTLGVQSIEPSSCDVKLRDGFNTIPEPESIHLETCNIATASMPPEAFTFVPNESALKNVFANGDSERLIHMHTKLDAAEEKALQELRREACDKGHCFYPSIAAAATRYLADAKGDPKMALYKMLMSQEWRANFFRHGPITDASVAEDLKHGVMYWAGRDRFLRPALVVRLGRAPLNLCNDAGTPRLIRTLLFFIEYFHRYLLVPGHVETFTLILDLRGLSLKKVALSTVREIHKVILQQQPCRTARFYIAGMNVMFSALSGVIQKLMTERQRNKVVFVRNVIELRKDFALHQLEEDLGGTRPVAHEFLPFPLEPGPFEAGYDKGSDPSNAIPGLHDILSAAGRLGKVWDTELSLEENQQLQFTEEAVSIVPESSELMPMLPRARPIPPLLDPIDVDLQQEGEPLKDSLTPATSSTQAGSLSDETERQETIIVEEEPMKPAAKPGRSFFMCGALHCNGLAVQVR